MLTEPRRSLVVVMCETPEGELSVLEDALAAHTREHTQLPPPPGRRWGVKTACSEALMAGTELVLLLAGQVHLSRSDASNLLENYEAGGRIVVGDRRTLSSRAMGRIGGMLIGSRRGDLESPVRMYDSAALKEIMAHLPDSSDHPLLLMTMIERRLRFAVREFRLRSPEVPGTEKHPLQMAGDLMSGLAAIWSFLPTARRIR